MDKELIDRGTYYEIKDYKPIVKFDENGNILVDTVFDRMMFDGVNQETGEALLKKGKNWLLINYKADIVTMFSGYNLNSSIQHGVIAAENIKTGKRTKRTNKQVPSKSSNC